MNNNSYARSIKRSRGNTPGKPLRLRFCTDIVYAQQDILDKYDGTKGDRSTPAPADEAANLLTANLTLVT